MSSDMGVFVSTAESATCERPYQQQVRREAQLPLRGAARPRATTDLQMNTTSKNARMGTRAKAARKPAVPVITGRRSPARITVLVPPKPAAHAAATNL